MPRPGRGCAVYGRVSHRVTLLPKNLELIQKREAMADAKANETRDEENSLDQGSKRLRTHPRWLGNPWRECGKKMKQTFFPDNVFPPMDSHDMHEKKGKLHHLHQQEKQLATTEVATTVTKDHESKTGTRSVVTQQQGLRHPPSHATSQTLVVPAFLQFKKWFLPIASSFTWQGTNGLLTAEPTAIYNTQRLTKNSILVFSFNTCTSLGHVLIGANTYRLSTRRTEQVNGIPNNAQDPSYYYKYQGRSLVEIDLRTGALIQAWTDWIPQFGDHPNNERTRATVVRLLLDHLKHDEVRVFRDEAAFDRANQHGKLNQAFERSVCLLETPASWVLS